MSTPTDLPPDELRALRERAYGRDADIQDDPAALARLHELEAQVATAMAGARAEAAAAAARTRAAGNGAPPRTVSMHAAVAGADAADAVTSEEERVTDAAPGADALPRAAAPLSAAATPGAPATGGAPRPDVVDASAVQPGGDEPGDDLPTADAFEAAEGSGAAGEAAARPWWRRRIPVLWAASVVAALILGAALSLWIQTLEEGGVAVLHEDADAEWPDQVFGSRPDGGRQFEEFHGLTVITFRQAFDSGGLQTCLYVLTAADGSGFGGGSCGAGAFPTTASMFVGSTSPQKLRDRFPEGTALQFVLDDSNLRVYAREPGIAEPTP